MHVMRMLFAVSVLLIASTVAGCAGGGPNPFTAPASNGSDSGYEDVRLTVENRDFRDATIYAYLEHVQAAGWFRRGEDVAHVPDEVARGGGPTRGRLRGPRWLSQRNHAGLTRRPLELLDHAHPVR